MSKNRFKTASALVAVAFIRSRSKEEMLEVLEPVMDLLLREISKTHDPQKTVDLVRRLFESSPLSRKARERIWDELETKLATFEKELPPQD